ncbi:hypothetical protein FDI69_gp226 [Rhodococcus phage Trina]|uniref:Uncharacterized protein n=1 Tax=Rhodococcus phage Trina TaxID=2027905 RepID=A0A2D1A6S9_9CAUD|nr:hypothetical protein FDI69_gp226 [Rhodococcus phage Trina]ASZ74960.1 hypothetical protein SEA_TRINA_172 [Rhodococcus phage Trina]
MVGKGGCVKRQPKSRPPSSYLNKPIPMPDWKNCPYDTPFGVMIRGNGPTTYTHKNNATLVVTYSNGVTQKFRFTSSRDKVIVYARHTATIVED